MTSKEIRALGEDQLVRLINEASHALLKMRRKREYDRIVKNAVWRDWNEFPEQRDTVTDHTPPSFQKRMSRFGYVFRSSNGGGCSTSYYAMTKTGILYKYVARDRRWRKW